MAQRILFWTVFLLQFLTFGQLLAQSTLTIDQIMQDPAWIGSQPSRLRWTENSEKLRFYWNPDEASADSLYEISPNEPSNPQKLSFAEQQLYPRSASGSYNQERTAKVYAHQGDLFWLDIASDRVERLTQTATNESNPKFVMNDEAIAYLAAGNLFLWYVESGRTVQLTRFTKGTDRKQGKKSKTDNQTWIEQEEQALIGILAERKETREASIEARTKLHLSGPKPYYLGSQTLRSLQLSPDGQYATFQLITSAKAPRTEVPNYIPESGYADMLRARPKVGSPQDRSRFGIYSVALDSVIIVKAEDLPGIKEAPDYMTDYGHPDTLKKPKATMILGPRWSADGAHAMVVIRSLDFKDRWIATIDLASGALKVVDHQHDEAWIGGPGIQRWLGTLGSVGWLKDNETLWYQSEVSGYSHLYTYNVNTEKTNQLTKGEFEVYNPKISMDGKTWYFTANAKHPGERHFYSMPIKGGKMKQITSGKGSHEVSLSPDEKWLAVRHSTTNRPWQLYLMPNRAGAEPMPVTHSIKEEWLAYHWREPEILTFEANDGEEVYARLYRPEQAEENGPAVIFVHGAGYLQNAHGWWSSYYREYMFHNLLVDNGYTVLDMDFRASAGYGRDVRTAVYRDMGGKDLSDQVDGAKFLVSKYGVDPKRIGIYGGSYGGFISLMAMFREGETFACGAALRPVTDWAHYNHGYTAAMLNMPQEDSLAYVRSSPIYHAEGLEGALLICHGMVDTNVHFQDVVRLAQRLIELRKEDWEVAIFPMEGHGFREPSSWADEYKRIFKLFEENLK
ncbi:MAG: prolyl oligopeptidase family serine peptidase [Bacteroidota bacterium]